MLVKAISHYQSILWRPQSPIQGQARLQQLSSMTCWPFLWEAKWWEGGWALEHLLSLWHDWEVSLQGKRVRVFGGSTHKPSTSEPDWSVRQQGFSMAHPVQKGPTHQDWGGGGVSIGIPFKLKCTSVEGNTFAVNIYFLPMDFISMESRFERNSHHLQFCYSQYHTPV